MHGLERGFSLLDSFWWGRYKATDNDTIVREEPVFLQTLLAGEGNPITLYAIYQYFQHAGIDTHVSLLESSTLPVRVFHRNMTNSPQQSERYTKNGANLRGGAGAHMLGLLSRLEMEWRNFAFFIEHPRTPWVGVQEHQFFGWTKDELSHRFPSVHQFVPDVFPKSSAIEIAKEKGIELLVWNQEAKEKLQQLGVLVKLISPVLPFSLAPHAALSKTLSNYVLIKTSGSGMPKTYIEQLIALCKKNGIDYEVWTPDRKLTALGEERLPSNVFERGTLFHRQLIEQPPALFVSYPSEMIQAIWAIWLKGLHIPHLTVPPRGSHEEANRKWGEEKNLTPHQISLDKSVSLTQLNMVFRRALTSTSTPHGTEEVYDNALVTLFNQKARSRF